MKKIVSMLSVALFATIFAAGCGKPTKCDEVKVKADCEKADTFDKEKGDKGVCKWEPKDASKPDGEGKCVAGKPETDTEKKAREKAEKDKKDADEFNKNLKAYEDDVNGLAKDKKACVDVDASADTVENDAKVTNAANGCAAAGAAFSQAGKDLKATCTFVAQGKNDGKDTKGCKFNAPAKKKVE